MRPFGAPTLEVQPVTIERLRASLADRYRLERELGQGGMATVYLAQDLKHDRLVAIKVLRPELAAVIGAERFLSEIKTTANLQHPHILPLFDSGIAVDSGSGTGTGPDDAPRRRSAEYLFYVMPFIEGESLRDRLNREKQLPIADAVRIATEVASALDYAHRHGVIHRDIKPENVLLHDGQALVADFGIALAASKAGGTRMTETGMSLGTPTYMSPEQAMGEREITARSDVYALGAMTYEMLLGEPPFTGPTAQAIVAKVMTEKPASLSARRDRIPAAVEEAVLTALEKLPADRWGSAAEFAAALTGGDSATRRFGDSGRRVDTAAGNPMALLAAILVATVATLAAGFFAVKASRRPSQPVTRLMLDLPNIRVNHQGYFGATFVLAPDGSRLAYLALSSGKSRLMVRERGELAPRVLEGTEGADGPFFSPDGRWIGYSAAGKLYKVPVSGGAPVLLAAQTAADAATLAFTLAGGTWFEDDRILFTDGYFNLRQVSAAGGPVTIVARPPVNGGMVFPTALPRSDVILATMCGNNCAQMTLVALNLKTLAQDTILPNAARGWYLPTGQLVVVQQDGSVRAGRFDLDRLRFSEPPGVVFAGVQMELGTTPELSIADDGTLVYLAANQTGSDATVARVDRTGVPRTLDPDWAERFTSMALSPDGRQVAVSTPEGGANIMWVKQLPAGPLTRLSFDGTINYRPAWRPDSRTLSYTSDRVAPNSFLYQVRADGSARPERLLPSDTTQVDEAVWSKDGRWLVYRAGITAGVRDIYARPLSGDTSRVTVAAGAFDEYMPALSPDGRWIAYVSTESGREEIYVRPFPEAERARWQASTAGGSAPVWSRSGRELFYVDRADSLIALTVTGTPDFQVTARRALFGTRPFVMLPFHRSYDVGVDDQSFVMLKRSSAIGAEVDRLTVVLNWFAELDAKAGRAR